MKPDRPCATDGCIPETSERWTTRAIVFIVDRVKDMINVSGFKVWPAEVEEFLYKHPAIQEVAVFGCPHPEKGETVVAAIVLKEGAKTTVQTSSHIAAITWRHTRLRRASISYRNCPRALPARS